MTSAVIQGEGLGKSYQRGARQQTMLLHDHLARILKSPRSAFRRPKAETFWALKDVSLDVREGEVLGLIGRNGAGKTTLLKILSRVIRPTVGWAEIHGRVGSLLEVGTGFHPELTGRENVFMSGAILGMRAEEIRRKFDEIVDFSEVERFLDTPLKHFSSGMQVRLAFAVAAHLEPEILLVDEVLAVGDLQFQKKCLGKMSDVARAGRTIVLVSHQLNQIRRLCHRVVWIDDGQVRKDGNTHEVLSAYESAMARGDSNGHSPAHVTNSKGGFLRWAIIDPQSNEPHFLNSLGPVTLKFIVEVQRPIRRGHHGIALFNAERQLIWAWAAENLQLEIGKHDLCYTFPMLPLRPGPYSWHVSLYDEGQEVDAWECLPEMVVATETHQHQYDNWNGILNMPSRFEITTEDKIGKDVAL
jgi:lipopolysaccharide transport system ATP-binding protein